MATAIPGIAVGIPGVVMSNDVSPVSTLVHRKTTSVDSKEQAAGVQRSQLAMGTATLRSTPPDLPPPPPGGPGQESAFADPAIVAAIPGVAEPQKVAPAAAPRKMPDVNASPGILKRPGAKRPLPSPAGSLPAAGPASQPEERHDDDSSAATRSALATDDRITKKLLSSPTCVVAVLVSLLTAAIVIPATLLMAR
jgi:hypothetical protein